MLDSYTGTRHVLIANSLDDYLAGKIILKRKAIVLIMNLSIWIFIIKCLLMVFLEKNSSLIWLSGDFSYLYPRPDILNILVFILYLSTALGGKLSDKSKRSPSSAFLD